MKGNFAVEMFDVHEFIAAIHNYHDTFVNEDKW